MLHLELSYIILYMDHIYNMVHKLMITVLVVLKMVKIKRKTHNKNEIK